MRIIKEIRIGYFRSFSQKVEVKTIKDLNIFSGKNDSGKSNILKALNVRISRVVYSLFDKSTFEVSHKELSCSTTYGV